MRPLACALALSILAGCGGGGSATTTPPPPPPPPITFPIAPGAAVSTRGYSGGTMTFNFGSGVPAGESFTVGPLAKPPPPSCPPQSPACALPLQPVDAVEITVGPAALPLSAVTSVALSGFAIPSASFTLVDTTVDEGTTVFASTPSGGPLVETHAYPDENVPIATLQPNRRYVFSLWQFASIDKPPGSSFIPPGGTLATTVSGTGDTITLVFGNAIPAKQWIFFAPVPQSTVTVPPNTVDAISIETSSMQLPPSAITGVILTTTRAFAGTRLEAGLTGEVSESGLSTALPFAIAPPGSQPNPAQLTFQTGPDYGTSLTTIHPSVGYVLSIRTY